MRHRLLQTKLGRLLIVADGRGIVRVQFEDAQHPSTPAPDSKPGGGLVDEAARQLGAYLRGDLIQFDLPLAPAGTPFQQRVWTQLRKIPYGQTACYGDIARRLRMSKAARAVGGACHRNPIGIIIPCHRVIGRSGSLTGYASGLERKRKLLALERRCVR